MRRINVVGTSGSGKSTFSKLLANKLGYPCYEMDQINWKPGWVESSDEEFSSRLAAITSQPEWVLDGNYHRSVPVKWANVDAVIWIDYSYTRTVFQALKRGIVRAVTKQEIWPGTGNKESFRKLFFSRDSVFLWMLKTYQSNKARYERIMSLSDFSHIHFVRLRSPKAAKEFLEQLDGYEVRYKDRTSSSS